MSNAELRERVARGIAKRMFGLGWQVLNDDARDGYRRSADAALAAVGLDDLEAAAERMARCLYYHGSGYDIDADPVARDSMLVECRAVLDAALTPSETD